MIKSSTQRKVRTCERLILISGVLFSLVLFLIYYFKKILAFEALFGYAMGAVSFFFLAEFMLRIEKLSKWIIALAIFVSNLKLLGIFSITYLLCKIGFSVIPIVLGIFLCQLVMIFGIVLSIIRNNKADETNDGEIESENACS